MTTQTEGWFGPATSRRYHYFRDGKSLCGKWMQFTTPDRVPWDTAIGPADGDCAGCTSALAKAPA